MSDDTTQTPATPLKPAQPVYPPVDATKPVPPVVPFAAWTWNTPVIPQFYWNVYSAEQRVRQICVEIGKIQDYLSYFAQSSNASHWYLDNRFTQTELRLTNRLDALEKELDEEVTRLDEAIAAEAKAREDADKALSDRIDGMTVTAGRHIELTKGATGTRIDNTMPDIVAGNGITVRDEPGANTATVAADMEVLASKATTDRLRIDINSEMQARNAADVALGARIDSETSERKAADTALDAKVTAEAQTRLTEDGKLETAVETETAAREAADTALGARVDTEVEARTDADTNLDGRITTEAGNRKTADDLLRAQVNARVKAVNVRAADNTHITVHTTSSDTNPDETTVTIGDTFTPAFERLEEAIAKETTDRTAAVSKVERALASEVDERRHDDEVQNEAIAQRLKFGAVKAGNGIVVTDDPDKSTVTVAADADWVAAHGGLAAVAHDGSLTGTGASDSPLKVATRGVYSTTTERVAARLCPNSTNAPTVVLDASSFAVDYSSNASVPDIVRLKSKGMSSVAHDTSLTGAGTKADPLGVVTSADGGLSVKANNGGLEVNVGSSLTIDDANQIEVSCMKLADSSVPETVQLWRTSNSSARVRFGSGLKGSGEMLQLNWGTELMGTKQLLVTHDSANHPAINVDPKEFNTGSGSDSYKLRLNPATKTTLGGVMVGSNLSVDADGVLSAEVLRSVKSVYTDPVEVDSAYMPKETSYWLNVYDSLDGATPKRTGIDMFQPATQMFSVDTGYVYSYDAATNAHKNDVFIAYLALEFGVMKSGEFVTTIEGLGQPYMQSGYVPFPVGTAHRDSDNHIIAFASVTGRTMGGIGTPTHVRMRFDVVNFD